MRARASRHSWRSGTRSGGIPDAARLRRKFWYRAPSARPPLRASRQSGDSRQVLDRHLTIWTRLSVHYQFGRSELLIDARLFQNIVSRMPALDLAWDRDDQPAPVGILPLFVARPALADFDPTGRLQKALHLPFVGRHCDIRARCMSGLAFLLRHSAASVHQPGTRDVDGAHAARPVALSAEAAPLPALQHHEARSNYAQ